MRVAVSATGTNLEAEVAPRFGRCRYLLFIDPDSLAFECRDNSAMAASGGAGIATAQAVANSETQAVLTGNVGPNAHQVLTEAGIEVYTGMSGKVIDVIGTYKSGRLRRSAEPTVKANAGMSSTPQQTGAQGDVDILYDRIESMRQQLEGLIGRVDSLEKRVA